MRDKVLSAAGVVEDHAQKKSMIEGRLYKQQQHRRGWHHRWVALYTDSLVYYLDEHSDVPIGEITLSPDFFVSDSTVRPHCFQVSDLVTSYYLSCDTKEEKMFWMFTIARVLQSLSISPAEIIPVHFAKLEETVEAKVEEYASRRPPSMRVLNQNRALLPAPSVNDSKNGSASAKAPQPGSYADRVLNGATPPANKAPPPPPPPAGKAPPPPPPPSSKPPPAPPIPMVSPPVPTSVVVSKPTVSESLAAIQLSAPASEPNLVKEQVKPISWANKASAVPQPISKKDPPVNTEPSSTFTGQIKSTPESESKSSQWPRGNVGKSIPPQPQISAGSSQTISVVPAATGSKFAGGGSGSSSALAAKIAANRNASTAVSFVPAVATTQPIVAEAGSVQKKVPVWGNQANNTPANVDNKPSYITSNEKLDSPTQGSVPIISSPVPAAMNTVNSSPIAATKTPEQQKQPQQLLSGAPISSPKPGIPPRPSAVDSGNSVAVTTTPPLPVATSTAAPPLPVATSTVVSSTPIEISASLVENVEASVKTNRPLSYAKVVAVSKGTVSTTAVKPAAVPSPIKKVEPTVSVQVTQQASKNVGDNPAKVEAKAASLPESETINVASRAQMWKAKVDSHQETQAKNPFREGSEPVGSSVLKVGDAGYGTAKEGTLTAERAAKAAEWVAQEIDKLLDVIRRIGTTKSDGTVVVCFGPLFYTYQDISDTLVGIMMRAKKRKFISYPGLPVINYYSALIFILI